MSTALVVAHEIHGPNEHILRMSEAVRRPEWAATTPNLLPDNRVYRSDEGGLACRRFAEGPGVAGMAKVLAEHAAELRTDHERLLCLGFGVGATAAWLASDAFDAIACVYGSRIRDHAHHRPRCPCLAILAEHEPGAAPLAACLAGPTVAVELFDADHGFCDEDDPRHHPAHRAAAVRAVRRFFHAD